MPGDISHNDAMAILEWISEITNSPLVFAKGSYDDNREAGKSRLEAVTTVVMWMIAENEELLNNIVTIRKNYMEE